MSNQRFAATVLVVSAVFAASSCGRYQRNFASGDLPAAGSSGAGGMSAGIQPGRSSAGENNLLATAGSAGTDSAAGTANTTTGGSATASAGTTGDPGSAGCGDVTTDPKNCGRCGHDCTSSPNLANNADGIKCSGGTCVIPDSACATNKKHCSASATDICETDLTSSANCGDCGKTCGASQVCSSGKCLDTCPGGTTQCTTGGSNGCYDLTSSTGHCGSCAVSCPSPTANGMATCQNSCQVACKTNYHQCGSKVECESDTDPAFCGPNCQACATTDTNATPKCSGGACSYPCKSGFHLCNGLCSADTSIASCGASCSPCPTVANGSYSCLSSGACNLTCANDFVQCQGGARSCAPATWSFEDGSAAGFTLDSGVSESADGIAVSTTRAAAGTHSLAVPATFNCTRRAFEVLVYPCSIGTPVNLLGKTLKFQVFIDGPAFLSGPLEASVNIMSSSVRSVDIKPAVGAWIPVSVPLNDPTDASDSGFSFELYMIPSGPPPGNVCGSWSGTIYLDDFSIR